MSAPADPTIPYDPIVTALGVDLPLGSLARAQFLSEIHDDVEGRLIVLDREAAHARLTQHMALERTRLWIFRDWLERETIAAYAALSPETAEKLRSGEPIV